MSDNVFPDCDANAPRIVVGVTTAQTCLILRGRVSALRRAGFHVTVVSGPGPLLDRFGSSQSVDVVAVPIEREISLLADLLSLYRIWRLLQRLRPDIVEFSTPKAGLLGLLAARLCGIRCRVYLLRGLKLETAHGLKRRVLLVAERIAVACAHVVVCNSPSLRARVLELEIGPPTKFLVLGRGSSTGVDTARFSPGPTMIREDLRIPSDVPVVGFVGRLTCDKGIVELVEAFGPILETRPEARLLLVGWFDKAEDAVSSDLRRKIEDHPHIIVTGLVESTEAYYRAMDVFVLPTWREGFPNAAIEAAATGIPVITTEATGARDAVLPGETGLRIPPGSPEAICEAVLRLLENPARSEQMGRAGREWVDQNYAETRVLGAMVDFFREWKEKTARVVRVGS